MKGYVGLVLLASFGVAGFPALAEQVVATESVTLTEAAQAKFNRDTGTGGDRYVKPIPGSAEPTRQLYSSAGLTVDEGRGLSLEQVFVAKINRESRDDNQQWVMADEGLSIGSRAYGSGGDYGRLAASAGLSAAEASELSLSDIAAAKFVAEGNHDY
jgi:hypothetical protein